MKTQVYNQLTIDKLRSQTARLITIYVGIAIIFVAFCGVFCHLANKYLLDLYLCFALNVVATIAFLWYSYLFFTIQAKPIFARNNFAKNTYSCLPLVQVLKLTSYESGCDGYNVLTFDNAVELKLDAFHPVMKKGVTYKIEEVDGIIVAYSEVPNDKI